MTAISRPLYKELATVLQAYESCRKSGNNEWRDKHLERLESLVEEYMPSGSGIDSGTTLNYMSKPNKLIFDTSYHHMNENGFYDGWTSHVVEVTPSLVNDFDLRITGRDRNDIKEYLYQVFEAALTQVITWEV